MKPTHLLLAAVVLTGLALAPRANAQPSHVPSTGASDEAIVPPGGGGSGGWNGGGGMPSTGPDPVRPHPHQGGNGGTKPGSGGRPPYPGHDQPSGPHIPLNPTGN